MHRVGLHTTRIRNELRYLFMLLCISGPRCTVIEYITAQWSRLYCRACCVLNFRDANNVPCVPSLGAVEAVRVYGCCHTSPYHAGTVS